MGKLGASVRILWRPVPLFVLNTFTVQSRIHSWAFGAVWLGVATHLESVIFLNHRILRVYSQVIS